jgi:hypothetical protein
MASVGRGADARFRHRQLGYEIADPRGASVGPAWERFEVDGADLAFRTSGLPVDRSSTMSLQSDCRPTQADPAMLARHLRIGLPAPVLLQGAPTEVAGQAGWSQVFETPERRGPVRVKTVTSPIGGCIFDWILVAREGFEPLERSFDAWWSSFRRPSSVETPLRSEGPS